MLKGLLSFHEAALALGMVVLMGATAPEVMAARPTVPDFCFIQVSDIHIGPLPGKGKVPDGEEGARSTVTIAWICEEAKGAQRLEPMGLTTPPPAFALATGDLTEYGVIGRTWDHWERLFKPLELPIYVVAGNHDNTWTSMMTILRKRHGGDHYSFDKFGCHFAGLDSATIQEPLPSLEARTLNWLREDLKRVPKDRPVFLFQHHPLGTTEFASPIEQLRFLEVIRDHNVVLLLMGHGHGVRTERWNTLDSVMGGSTFGPNSGYSIISVMDGVLRVVYRYKDSGKPMQKLLEKSIAPRDPMRVEVTLPKAFSEVTGETIVAAARMRGATVKSVTADIDASEKSRSALLPGSAGFTGRLSTAGLLPGWHFVHVKAETDAGPFDRAVEFLYSPPESKVQETTVELSAGMKAKPIVVEGGCVVVTTSGEVARIAFHGPLAGKKPAVRTLYRTGAEIIHTPALVDGRLYLSSAELGVFSMDLDGKLNWKRPVGAPVYGTPAVTADAVYVGDLEGSVHAIDRATGALKWSKPHATFSIEAPLTFHEGTLYFGAWDGYVYAVDAADGALKWKLPGPAGQTGKPGMRSRYYAPGDCAPVMIGDRLFVTDRAYRMGSYSLDGKYLGPAGEGVTAIGQTEDGAGVYSRTLEKGVTRYDAEGKPVWTRPVPLGHYATPPTASGGKVYVCSNYGVLSAIDAGKGDLLWQYQVSPRLHVIAAVAADEQGNVYTAGMDGLVTKVRNGP